MNVCNINLTEAIRNSLTQIILKNTKRLPMKEGDMNVKKVIMKSQKQMISRNTKARPWMLMIIRVTNARRNPMKLIFLNKIADCSWKEQLTCRSWTSMETSRNTHFYRVYDPLCGVKVKGIISLAPLRFWPKIPQTVIACSEYRLHLLHRCKWVASQLNYVILDYGCRVT